MADERVKIIDIQVKYQQAVDALAKFRSSLAEAKKYQADLKKEHDAFKALYADELNLQPLREAIQETEVADAQPLTAVELDSMLWVTQHGYPSTWYPYPQPLLPVSFGF